MNELQRLGLEWNQTSMESWKLTERRGKKRLLAWLNLCHGKWIPSARNPSLDVEIQDPLPLQEAKSWAEQKTLSAWGEKLEQALPEAPQQEAKGEPTK